MTNYEKYFKDIDTASKTLEDLGFQKLNICKNFCVFYNDCNNDNPIIDDYDCIDGIKYFLQKECKKEE